MEATAKTFEVTIPEQYITVIRNVVKALGGRMKAMKKVRKTGLDEALEDIKAGRVYHAESVDDMFKQILG